MKTPITATELCEQAGYSLFHYYRLFQSAVGMSVMQYILRRRLIHAIYEIRCGGKRIDVILEYGFDTYAGFYKAFRREFDCTPSTYIKKGRAKRPYKLNLYKDDDYMVSHKKALDVLKHWKLENETISDVYHESNGEKNNRAFYVGKNFVLKFTKNYDEAKNAIALCNAIKGVAILSESFDEKDQAKLSKWLEIYRNILWGYDSVVKLTNEECAALPYVVMADQLVSTAWFSEQDKYTELFEINKRMTQWLITISDKLKIN